VTTLLWDGRYRLITAVLAGFGRAIAEVGAVMIAGGNIDHVTRTMTTAIALETSKGNITLALALGMVLLAVALSINMAAMGIRRIASYFALRGLSFQAAGRRLIDGLDLTIEDIGHQHHYGVKRRRQEPLA
jgi:hypothetical protein